MDEFDLIFSIDNDNGNEVNHVTKYKCQYSNIMKSFGNHVYPCYHEPKKNATLCKFHRVCTICQNPTENGNTKLCIVCDNKDVTCFSMNGYIVSSKCLKIITPKYKHVSRQLQKYDYTHIYKKNKICEECYNLNKCSLCHKNLKLINYFLHDVCAACIYEFNCLNCNKAWAKKYEKAPDLCPECIPKVNACNTCKKVFPLKSIEFSLEQLDCAICIATNDKIITDTSCMIKASLIYWRTNGQFYQYIKNIYERKDNKVNIDLIYHLVIHLLWEIKTPETYYKTLKLLTRSNFASNEEIINYLPKSDMDNLLGLFVRCANLSHDLFWYIMKMI